MVDPEAWRAQAATCACRRRYEPTGQVLPGDCQAGPGEACMAGPDIEVMSLGLVSFRAGLVGQAEAAARVREGTRVGILMALRHPPVITLGRRAAPEELHMGPVALQSLGVDVYPVDRGGGATYHYPEQAVVYPILDLRRLRLTVPRLLAITGDAVLEVLRSVGVEATWDPERPGAYVDGAKVASVGYHLSKELTTHGVAVNLGRDLRGFDYIDPCKVRDQPIASVEGLTGTCPDPDATALALANAIAARLGDSPGS